MKTFSRTFILAQDEREIIIQKIKHLYTEIMPLQLGFIASKLDFTEDKSQVLAIANWSNEDQFLALQDTPAFKDLARQVG